MQGNDAAYTLQALLGMAIPARHGTIGLAFCKVILPRAASMQEEQGSAPTL